ncbi:MAG: hypothetical protein R3F48_03405 [Candidatus Zixiibacteriota bacterium]
MKGYLMSTGKYSPAIRITTIIWLAFMIANFSYLSIAYSITKHRDADLFIIHIPEQLSILFLALCGVSVIGIIIGFIIRSKLPAAFLQARNTAALPMAGSAKMQKMDPEARTTAIHAQTISIVLFAFFESVGIYGLLLVMMGCTFFTMVPFVLISLTCLFFARPTEAFFDRVGERLRELNL